jgi:uncharacterized membrane protein
MNIENNKQRNKDAAKESAAYVYCILFFIGTAVISCGYLQEVSSGMGVGFWVATFAMWISLFLVIVTIIVAIARETGYNGKRDKIDDIF